eukprot:TRINITY_DN3085_c0_g1_i1.p1 TRINITY_DN3085_c0_g1~~TRINITY_DN3085_c0_g1_i1.p1  ORF type:complete len:82 (-),score=27.85 TRINITY_DN3085_c0_g1_i1:69-314(-)
MYMNRLKAEADAEFYKRTKEAEGNKGKLTPEYLQSLALQSISQNTKIFFGEKIPNMFASDFAALINGNEKPKLFMNRESEE